MTFPPRPDAPRAHARGASSWARKVNDSTLEMLAAWMRIWAVAWSLFFIVMLFWLLFAPAWNVAGAATLSLVLLGAHIWAGFFWLANPEWRQTPDGD